MDTMPTTLPAVAPIVRDQGTLLPLQGNCFTVRFGLNPYNQKEVSFKPEKQVERKGQA